MAWDPWQYLLYGDERSRPFGDLLSQVGADDPRRVVDLGCGTGALTATLAQRWPGAEVLGIDSSPQMLADSASNAGPSVRFVEGAAEDYDASGVDVLISNALLQWVPEHRQLLQQWAAQLNPGGWLAFQVPANFDSPSHELMRAVAAEPRWADLLVGVLRHADAVSTPEAYLDQLAGAGLTVNAWQTEYLHVLPGDDPVLQWVSGTGLRPILLALNDADRTEFTADYAARLRIAYPRKSYGTVLKFRRTFVVAHHG